MANYKIQTVKGIKTVEGEKFLHTINGVKYWFFIHECQDNSGLKSISEVRTGFRLCEIMHTALLKCKSEREAAKATIDILLEKYNSYMVMRVIDSTKSVASVELDIRKEA